MNWILCGLPMSGKTTIGCLLAETLGLNYIDTDRLIECAYAKKEGRTGTCRQIFLERGEHYFREIEKQVIEALRGEEAAVISLGGGSLLHADHVACLQRIGHIIYLKALPEILWKRMLEKGIPAYLDQQDPERSFYALVKKRTSHYEQACHVTIETGTLQASEVVKTIIQSIKEIKDGK